MDILDLYTERRSIEDRIDNFFGDENPNYGDRGYQILLESLDEVNEKIEDLEN